MVIGAWLANSFFLNGKVDEVRFWNLARSQVQIQATMNDTLGPQYYTTSDSGLVAYYRFDQLENLGAGGDGLTDDVRDLSVNGTHGDLVGDALLIFSNASLPVELSLFTASTFEQSIHLDWQTQTETNNFGFQVERNISTDWKTIGFVAGQGTTIQPQSYEFIDDFSEIEPEIPRPCVSFFC